MSAKNLVLLKGRKDGIIFVLDPEADFDELKEALRDKIRNASGFFEEGNAPVSFSGRALTDDEKNELLNVIRVTLSVEVSFVGSLGAPAPKAPKISKEDRETLARSSVKRSQSPPEAQQAVSSKLLPENSGSTSYYHGAIRSGVSINTPGSVVVVGNVNTGAEIAAGGSIIVLGSVKGIVHAGCPNNPDGFIAALSLKPLKLFIAGVEIYLPPETTKQAKPLYVYTKDGDVFVAPLGE